MWTANEWWAHGLDLLVLLLFGLMVWLGWKRGFFKTVMRLVSLGVALLTATLLSQPAARWLYDCFLRERLTDLVTERLTAADSTLVSGVDSLMTGLPGIVQNALSAEGLGSAADILTRAGVSAQATPNEAAKAILGNVVEPLTVTLMAGACFIVIFVLSLVAMWLLTRAADVALKLPVLKQINRGLGFLAGAAAGLLWVWVLAQIILLLSATVSFLSPDVIEKTWILQLFTGKFSLLP